MQKCHSPYASAIANQRFSSARIAYCSATPRAAPLEQRQPRLPLSDLREQIWDWQARPFKLWLVGDEIEVTVFQASPTMLHAVVLAMQATKAAVAAIEPVCRFVVLRQLASPASGN